MKIFSKCGYCSFLRLLIFPFLVTCSCFIALFLSITTHFFSTYNSFIYLCEHPKLLILQFLDDHCVHLISSGMSSCFARCSCGCADSSLSCNGMSCSHLSPGLTWVGCFSASWFCTCLYYLLFLNCEVYLWSLPCLLTHNSPNPWNLWSDRTAFCMLMRWLRPAS